MATIYHQVRMNAPIVKLYRAISIANGIGSWWDKATETQTDAGSLLEFNLGPDHGVLKMKVLERLPNKRVEWECISTHRKSSPASAWTGTHISFAISEKVPMSFEVTRRKHMAVLDFRHSGWDETNQYFGYCNFDWGQALAKLQKLSESK